MRIFWSFAVFFFSSAYVLLLDYFAFSSRGLQKSLVLPIIVLLLILYRAKVPSLQALMQNEGKWFLLLWGTILLQTLVIATGGFQSPFLILIHLFMIVISLLVSFSAAIIFLLCSFIVLFIDISFYSTIMTFLTTDPSTFILQLVSLFSIIPIAYIISRQYHVKDVISALLRTKINTDEAILESLNEMIIVTDANLKILSVNDAVSRMLQKTRSELTSMPILTALLIKDSHGKLLKDTFLFDHVEVNKTPKKLTGVFTIVNTSDSQKKTTIQVQSIKDIQQKSLQYIFVLTHTDDPHQENSISGTIQKARAKYEAMYENLKQTVTQKDTSSIYNQMLFVERLENDLYDAQLLVHTKYTSIPTKIDIAMLCKQMVALEQDFAKALQVSLDFTIKNFSQKDIEPLTVKNYPVLPEQLTGPFFTLACDTKGSELLLKKLLTLSLFLASSTSHGLVNVTIERSKQKAVTITIHTSCPKIEANEIQDLYLPNHGRLSTKTNLHAGSGLEGYMAKTISEYMDTPLTTSYIDKPNPEITFTWTLKTIEEGSAPKR